MYLLEDVHAILQDQSLRNRKFDSEVMRVIVRAAKLGRPTVSYTTHPFRIHFDEPEAPSQSAFSLNDSSNFIRSLKVMVKSISVTHGASPQLYWWEKLQRQPRYTVKYMLQSLFDACARHVARTENIDTTKDPVGLHEATCAYIRDFGQYKEGAKLFYKHVCKGTDYDTLATRIIQAVHTQFTYKHKPNKTRNFF